MNHTKCIAVRTIGPHSNGFQYKIILHTVLQRRTSPLDQIWSHQTSLITRIPGEVCVYFFSILFEEKVVMVYTLSIKPQRQALIPMGYKNHGSHLLFVGNERIFLTRKSMEEEGGNYTPRTTKLLGGILVSLRPSVRLSVRPSVCPSVRPSRLPCPLCNIYSSGWILSILSTNDHCHKRVCRTQWPLTLTYIFKVIRPWLRKSCPLCSVYSSGWILFVCSTNDHYH